MYTAYSNRVITVSEYKSHVELEIISAIDGESNYQYINETLKKNTYYKVKIEQVNVEKGVYHYSIYLDCIKLFWIFNREREYKNMKLYFNNPWHVVVLCNR